MIFLFERKHFLWFYEIVSPLLLCIHNIFDFHFIFTRQILLKILECHQILLRSLFTYLIILELCMSHKIFLNMSRFMLLWTQLCFPTIEDQMGCIIEDLIRWNRWHYTSKYSKCTQFIITVACCEKNIEIRLMENFCYIVKVRCDKCWMYCKCGISTS